MRNKTQLFFWNKSNEGGVDLTWEVSCVEEVVHQVHDVLLDPWPGCFVEGDVEAIRPRSCIAPHLIEESYDFLHVRLRESVQVIDGLGLFMVVQSGVDLAEYLCGKSSSEIIGEHLSYISWEGLYLALGISNIIDAVSSVSFEDGSMEKISIFVTFLNPLFFVSLPVII